MRIRRAEALTGALVVATGGVLLTVLLALGAPGLLRPRNTYYVFFDNAGGIRPGTDVYLAGRLVGQVVGLQSPVPAAKRPSDHPECEALIEVRVRKDAKIYQRVTVRMEAYGLMGLELIDFVGGDETSGLAASGGVFVGERVPGLTEATPALLKLLQPVSEEATSTLAEMRTTLANLNGLTGEGGDLRQAVSNTRDFTDTIKRQPWRLLWRSTKKYPEDQVDDEEHKGRKRELASREHDP